MRLALEALIDGVLNEMDFEVLSIEADDRFPHKRSQIANTDVNAPLALIQLEMRMRRATILKYAAKIRRGLT